MSTKALLVSVYRPAAGSGHNDCSNGGVTSKHTDLLLECDKGPFDPESHPDTPLLRVGVRYGHAYAYPAFGSTDPAKTIGPMFGGNFVYTTDARFHQMLEELLDIDCWSGALPVHDRFETPEQYEALSR